MNCLHFIIEDRRNGNDSVCDNSITSFLIIKRTLGNEGHIMLLLRWSCIFYVVSLKKLLPFVAEHKYDIVKRLQARNHICGMTGDGVNDAPALKKADIGIAVACATDAARSASDIVLTEPGLSVIISAVLTSRSIFQRMKNYTVSLFLRTDFFPTNCCNCQVKQNFVYWILSTCKWVSIIVNWFFCSLLHRRSVVPHCFLVYGKNGCQTSRLHECV